MFWTDLFIKKPIFSILIIFILIVVGAFSYWHLDIRLYPKVKPDSIQISVQYPGASALTMKNIVSRRIFDDLSDLDNLDYIRSTNTEGHTLIWLHFFSGSDVKNELNRLLGKMMSFRSDLPSGIHEPDLSIMDSNENPDELIAFSASDRNSENITDYLIRYFKPKIEAIPGVSSVTVLGPHLALRIALRPDKMRAYGLGVADILSSLEDQNRPTISGNFQTENKAWDLPLNMPLSSAKDFSDIVIKKEAQDFVFLSEVAHIFWGTETDRIRAYYNESPAAFLSIKIASQANILKVLHSVNNTLAHIKKDLPSGFSAHELVNSGHYIKSLIMEMLKTLFLSFLMLILLSFLFFSSIRSALIMIMSIPLALLGLGIVLWIFGASINALSLLGLIVVMGLLADDAIVLIENCIRHLEANSSAVTSCILATREISYPVISMTLSLMALFFPLVCMGGITGGIFFDFSIILLGSVMISGILALTVIPMLCGKFLQLGKSQENSIFKAWYLKILDLVLNYRRGFFFLWGILALFGVSAYILSPMNFAPKEDARLLEVIDQAPDSSNIHFLRKNADALAHIYHLYPEIKSYSMILGIPSEHEILSFVRLYPKRPDTRETEEIQHALQDSIRHQTDLNAVAIMPNFMPGSQKMPIEFVLSSAGSYRDLFAISSRIMEAAQKSGLFLFLDRDLHYDRSTLNLEIKRKRAAFLNVPLDRIESAVSNFLGDNTFQYFSRQGELYPLIIQSQDKTKGNYDFLDHIYVKSMGDKLISLSSLVNIRSSTSPEQLNQFQKFNSVTISAVMKPYISLSQGLEFLREEAKSLLPSTVHYDFSGNARSWQLEKQRMSSFFLLSFFCIFIVLALQFESILDPFIIFFGSVPAAILGSMIPFCLGLAKMNIYTPIALLVMSGLVSKHGILITQFTHTLVRRGLPCSEAIIQAVSIRFRPILLSSLAIILGALPLLFSKGPGFEARFSVGIVLLSGMTLGSLFSLFILPVLYCFFHSDNKV